MIESHIKGLKASFGQTRKPVAEELLRDLYEAGNYEQLAYSIKEILNLNMRFFLGLVNRGGPTSAPAWISLSHPVPMFGTAEFRAFRATMYLRKSFLAVSSFEGVVIAIAHEFCHVVLYAINHSLQREEEAVDLTAMLLGFRDFYVTGCRSQKGYEVAEIGYLSFEEVGYAAEYMTFR